MGLFHTDLSICTEERELYFDNNVLAFRASARDGKDRLLFLYYKQTAILYLVR